MHQSTNVLRACLNAIVLAWPLENRENGNALNKVPLLMVH